MLLPTKKMNPMSIFLFWDRDTQLRTPRVDLVLQADWHHSFFCSGFACSIKIKSSRMDLLNW